MAEVRAAAGILWLVALAAACGTPIRISPMDSRGVHETLTEDVLTTGEPLRSVYRVLTQFEAAGLVTRHHFENGMAVFELNRGDHHDHIVCIECGTVAEFVDSAIEERQKAVARERGFELHDHSMILYGRCNNCRTRGAAAVRKTHHHG